MPMPTPRATPSPTRRRHGRRVLAIVGAVTAAIVLAGCLTPNQTKMVDLVNASRRGAGLHSVSANQAATNKAQAWALHMSRTGVVEHTGGGSRMDTSGLPKWCSVGENVAKARSIANAHDLWMRSSGHKANIVGNYNRVGTGVVRKGNVVYAVQIFYRAC